MNVEIFTSGCICDLEYDVNKFLSLIGDTDFLDIKFTTCQSEVRGDVDITYSAMIIYKFKDTK